MDRNDIDFVVRHYRKGCFGVGAGWNRLNGTSVSRWKKYRVAAAGAAIFVISATATIIYQEVRNIDSPPPTIETSAPGPLAEIKVINFENAPLTDVVNKIESVYNVKVQNLPEDVNDYQLSLHYEGTPTELISVINDILGTQMTVHE